MIAFTVLQRITGVKMARCKRCKGIGIECAISGERVFYLKPCPRCNGTGREPKERKGEKRT